MTGMERRIADLPGQLEQSVRPRQDEDAEKALDLAWWGGLDNEHPLKKTLNATPFDGELLPEHATALRTARLTDIEGKRQAEQRQGRATGPPRSACAAGSDVRPVHRSGCDWGLWWPQP